MPALIAPLLAFVVAGIAIVLIYRIVGRLRPGPVSRGFRLGQLVSGGLLALSHGTNDAQKTMGVITLALIAHGDIPAHRLPRPDLGRDRRRDRDRARHLSPAAGGSSARWAPGSSRWTPRRASPPRAPAPRSSSPPRTSAIPLSTTHVISGGIMGAGAAKRLSAVRWGVAGNIVDAWVLTLPAARASWAAVVYAISDPVRQRRNRPDRHQRRTAPRARSSVPTTPATSHPGTGDAMIAGAINTHALLKMAYSSLLAGVGVTVVFSIAILGATRSSEMRRAHRAGAATATPHSQPPGCYSPPPP